MHHLITYEIKPGFHRSTNAVREKLEGTITSFGSWWHYISDIWIVNTNMPVDQIASTIRQHLAEQHYLLVIAIQPPYQVWLPKEAWDWINKSVPQTFSGYQNTLLD